METDHNKMEQVSELIDSDQPKPMPTPESEPPTELEGELSADDQQSQPFMSTPELRQVYKIPSDSKGYFVIIRNGKSVEPPKPQETDEADNDLTSEYECAVDVLLDRFNLKKENKVYTGEDPPKLADNVRIGVDLLPGDGFKSFERFTRFMRGDIKNTGRWAMNETKRPSFLMVFLLSHGGEGDAFTLSPPTSPPEKCCQDRDAFILSRLYSSHRQNRRIACTCNCHTENNTSVKHIINPSDCDCQPDPLYLQKFAEEMGKDAAEARKTLDKLDQNRCKCSCHDICSCYSKNIACEKCKNHDSVNCHCACHEKHSWKGECLLRHVDDLVRDKEIQKLLSGIPKIFFYQACRADKAQWSQATPIKRPKLSPAVASGGSIPMNHHDPDTLVMYACHHGKTANPETFIEEVCREWENLASYMSETANTQKYSDERLRDNHLTGRIGQRLEIDILRDKDYRGAALWLTDLCQNVTRHVCDKHMLQIGRRNRQVPQMTSSMTLRVSCLDIMLTQTPAHQLEPSQEATADTEAKKESSVGQSGMEVSSPSSTSDTMVEEQQSSYDETEAAEPQVVDEESAELVEDDFVISPNK